MRAFSVRVMADAPEVNESVLGEAALRGVISPMQGLSLANSLGPSPTSSPSSSFRHRRSPSSPRSRPDEDPAFDVQARFPTEEVLALMAARASPQQRPSSPLATSRSDVNRLDEGLKQPWCGATGAALVLVAHSEPAPTARRERSPHATHTGRPVTGGVRLGHTEDRR